jgi:hypothetical protein
MGPTLDELIEQGQKLKDNGQFHELYERDDFWQWHESCVDFLECVPLSFREEVMCPDDVKKGIMWLKSTFRRHDDDDNHQ